MIRNLIAGGALVLCLVGPSHGTSPAPQLECLIEPQQVLRLSTPVEGLIAEVFVDRGDRVAAGTLVARLESRVEEADVALARLRAEDRFEIAAAEARLAHLQRRQARQEQLRASNVVAEAMADETATELMVAEQDLGLALHNRDLALIELRHAEARLARRSIASPIDGVVTERLMSPGEYRNEQSHIVTIAATDTLHVEAFAPLELYSVIAVGDRMAIVPEAPISGRHEAIVSVIDTVFDAASGTFGLRLDLPNPDGQLPAGLHCTAYPLPTED